MFLKSSLNPSFFHTAYDKVSLFITATHELGHALGLYHSDVEGSIMSPYLIEFPTTFKLPNDDVRGIQELYGNSHEIVILNYF